MQETQETRDKLANAITTLRNTGRGHEVDGLVTAYKAKYKTQADTGVAYNADQSALSQMKSRVAADQAAQDLKDEQMRMAIGDTATNVLGKIRDFGQGGPNAVTRLTADVGTLANSALNFTDNPAWVSGTASNKFLRGGVFDDEGAFKSKGLGNVSDVGVNLASMAIPASAGTKATALLNKGINLSKTARGVMSSGGIASKAIPLVTEIAGQSLAGTGAAMVQEGGYKEGEFGKQVAINAALPLGLKAVGGIAKRLGIGTTFANKLNQAANSMDNNAKQLLKTDEGKKFLAIKGIRESNGIPNMDDVKQVATKELGDVKNKFLNLSLNKSDRAAVQDIFANNTDDGAIATFVGNLVKKTNEKTGAFDSFDTIENINHYVKRVFEESNRGQVIKSLGSREDLPLNRFSIDDIRSDLLSAVETSDNANVKLAGRSLVDKFFNPTDLKKVATGEMSKLEFLDSIRIATNDKYIPNEVDANLMLGNQIRKIFDVLLDTGDYNKLTGAALDEYKALKLMNKYYADAQDAKVLAQAVNNINVGGRAGLTRMIGGIIATGGTYSPFGFAAGSIGADVLHALASKALNQNIFKVGVNNITDYTGDQLSILKQLTKHLAPAEKFESPIVRALTRKAVSNPVQLALPAPVKKPVQSLRDELIGTLSKPR